MQMLRRILDTLYFASGAAASLCLITILVLIVIQMLARWTGEVFRPRIMLVMRWRLPRFWLLPMP